jgi:hypothetical protein
VIKPVPRRQTMKRGKKKTPAEKKLFDRLVKDLTKLPRWKVEQIFKRAEEEYKEHLKWN